MLNSQTKNEKRPAHPHGLAGLTKKVFNMSCSLTCGDALPRHHHIDYIGVLVESTKEFLHLTSCILDAGKVPLVIVG